MFKFRIIAIVLCFTMCFAMFSNVVYAEIGVTFIDETTIVIKNGKLVSGDASLIESGLIVVGDDGVEGVDGEDTGHCTDVGTESSSKRPVKYDDDLLNKSVVNSPNATAKYIEPTLGFTKGEDNVNRTYYVTGHSNPWYPNSYQLMVWHCATTVSSVNQTIYASICARGYQSSTTIPSVNSNQSFTRVYAGPLFKVTGGTLNLSNNGSKNGGRVTVEGLRVYYTNYSRLVGNTTPFDPNIIGNWSYANWTNTDVWFDPLMLVSGGTANINETTFQNNVADESGSAIRVTGGTLKLENCKFLHNKSDASGGAIYVGDVATAVINNCEFDGNIAASNGGAIYVASGGKLTITNTTIKNNSAAHGGAIYLAGDCTITLNSVTIQNNTVTGNGGAMWVGTDATVNHTGGTISGNTAGQVGGAIALARAGAIYNLSGSGTISGNSAVQGGAVGCYGAGSGVTNNGSPDFNMSGGTISNNTATSTESGGAIYIRCGNGHSISGGTITDNKGIKGAAIYVYDASASYVGTSAGRITISGSANIYKNGNANTTLGGGAYVGTGGTLVMSGGTIGGTSLASHANIAGSGGGICIAGGTVTLSGGKINYNDASSNGGGIEMSSGTFTMTGGSVDGNEANYGGAIHLTAGCTVSLSGGTLNSNTATNSGGAIAQGGGNVNMSGTAKINSNTATSRGGGIYVSGASVLNITGSTTAGACTINSNTSNSQGGGIYIGEVTTADNVKINNVTINGNTATTNRGGGMYINPSATNKNVIIRVSGAVISNNTAEPVNSADTDVEGHGGGIYQANCVLYVSNCSFTSNTATVRGGGLYCTSNTVATVNNCSFTGNRSEGLQSSVAYGRGGGVYAFDGANVTIINSSFNGNVSNTHAGAIGANGGTTTITQLNLIDLTVGNTTANNASGGGGGVYAGNGTVLKIVRGKISNNTAGSDGGGIYADDATATVQISNSTDILTTVPNGVAATGAGIVIHNNTATAGNGGGICVNAAGVAISNAQISNNTSSGFGGGVQLYKAKGVGADAIPFSDVKINGNTSQANAGGGICVDSAVLNLSGNNEINGNTAYNYGGGLVVRVDGGGTGASTVNVNLDDAGSTAINNNTVTQSYGGGVHVSSLGVSSLNMKGGTINGNTCNNASGGGVDCEDNLSLNGTIISGNTAKNGGNIAFGGGINVRTSTGNLTLTNCTVDGNNAQCGGGIVVRAGATATVTGGTVTNNTADEAGGVLVFNGSTASISDITVSGNTAENGDGGGVLVAHESTLTMTDCYVINNTAEGVYSAGNTAMVSEETLVGTGGGLGVYDNSTLTFNVDNKGAIYGNSASTAGDDVFANGIGTQIYIPAPEEMDTSGFGKEGAVWWEDYMADDENYGQGLNGESRIIDRYDISPISVRAYTDDLEYINPKDEYVNDANQFVAITFDVPKYSVGSIRITAPSAADDDLRFLFGIKGKTILGDEVEFKISVEAGETVEIKQLFPGNYTVTAEADWTWRYSINGATVNQEAVSGDVGEINITITGTQVDETYDINYSSQRIADRWLNGNSPVQKNTAQLAVSRSFDIAEFKKAPELYPY